MHAATMVDDSGVMTPDDFVRVCMEHGLLNSSAAKARLQSEFENEDDKTNEELFAELAAKWALRGLEFEDRVAKMVEGDDKEAVKGRLAHYHKV